MNTQPNISIKLLPSYETPQIPLAIVIILSIVIGAVLILIFTITDWISFKIEKLKLKRKISSLEKELENCKKSIKSLEEENKNLKEQLEVEKSKQNIKVQLEDKDSGTLR
jgi:cell division protein FtsL